MQLTEVKQVCIHFRPFVHKVRLVFVRWFPPKSVNFLVKPFKELDCILNNFHCSSREPVDPNLWEFSPQVRLYGPRVLCLRKLSTPNVVKQRFSRINIGLDQLTVVFLHSEWTIVAQTTWRYANFWPRFAKRHFTVAESLTLLWILLLSDGVYLRRGLIMKYALWLKLTHSCAFV